MSNWNTECSKQGKLLRILRKQKKMSQIDLAELLHIEQSSVSRWETGNIEIDKQFYEPLADIFNIPVSAFWNPEETINQIERGNPIYEAIEVNRGMIDSSRKSLFNEIFWKRVSVVMVLMVAILCVLLYREKTHYRELDPVEIVSTRCMYDNTMQTNCLEVAVISNSYLSDRYIHEAAIYIRDNIWQYKLNVGKTNIIRVQFFKNDEQALNWESPVRTIDVAAFYCEEDH